MRKPSSFLTTKDPVARVQNGYEALYYNVESGDPEVDELLQKALSDAYREHDIVLEDNPPAGVQHEALTAAYMSVAQELNGSELSTNQRIAIEMSFDDFAKSNDHFYDNLVNAYDRRFDGEPIDFAADYARMLQENGGVDPRDREPELAADDLDDMFEQETPVTSGLNYAQAVPAVKATQQTAAYKPILDVPVSTEDKRKFKDSIDELKGINVDDKYEYYNESRGGQASHFTAGDDYGFDDDLEDDGPEL